MSERSGSGPETSHEYIPSHEEVKAKFEELVQGKKYVEIRKDEDEQGLCRWDIETRADDGRIEEYSYVRKGDRLSTGVIVETAIHVTYYDKEGIPYNGYSVMKCDEHGVWKLTLNFVSDQLKR